MFPSKSSLTLFGARRPWAMLLGGMTLAAALACGGGGSSSSSDNTPPPPPPPVAPPYTRAAALRGSDEVPATASMAQASGSVTVDPNTLMITGSLVSTGIVGTQAHIHDGAPGVAGSVVIPLSGGAAGVWSIPAGTVLTSAQFTSLQAGNYYFNIHSDSSPAGEIRGQIELQPMFATLDGTQETPATGSTASGSGVLSVNPATGAAYASIMSTGIDGVDAHVHDGAIGVAGPVIVPLQGAGGGLWNSPAGALLTPTQVATFQAGGLYGNVHTLAFPNGEIRGQFNLATAVVRSTTLGGANEVPANASTATGTGTFALDPKTLELRGGVTTSGISGVAAHIHIGAAGVAGAVIVPLDQNADGTFTTPAGTFLTPAQFMALRSGGLYVNVHSVAYSAGEIRGQIPADAGATTGGGGGGGGTGGGGY